MLVLAEDFHADRSLTGDDIGIVKGMDEDVLMLFLKFECVQVGIGIAVPAEDDLGPQGADRVGFEFGSGHGHDNMRLAAELTGTEGDTLGMVSGGRADDATLEFGGCQSRHFIVGTTEFEAVDRLFVFALEPDLVSQSV